MPVQLREIMLVGAGGFAGSICRYLASIGLLVAGGPSGLPVATFTVNATGSLLIGLFMAIFGNGSLHLLLAVGFCGGFTTFSTFSAETLALIRSGQPWTAVVYALASVVVCVVFVMLGMYAGTRLKGI